MLALLSCVALGAIFTILYVLYKPPRTVICYAQCRWKDVIWHVQTSQKIVALTIDDGPSEYTLEILEILKANDATATFFIIGSHVTPGREASLHALIRAGNELANHGMRDEPSYLLSETELINNIDAVHKILSKAETTVGTIEIAPRRLFFRPGSGIFTRTMRRVLQNKGYCLALGDIYPHDPFISFWKINYWHVLSSVRPGGIIVCHDGRSWTIPFLRKLLPELKQRGYRVVTLSKLLKVEERD